jgi:uncharacterized protein (TIGR00251 family)
MNPKFLRETAEGLHLALKVQPRASRNAVAGVHGDELKVSVTAPPVDSAANEAVVRFIAEVLGCPRGAVQILRGQTSRHKILLIRGVPAAQVVSKLGVPGAG